jgi:catechol 2,3-dioxygenase-like lactoylglutathione lyase family enzyme
MPEPARAIAHVGITVPDMDAAVEWYSKVFGMRLVKDVGVLALGVNGPIDDLCVDIFGEEFDSVKVGHLSAANGVIVELFEFSKPAYEKDEPSFQYWRGGIFHFAVIAEDVEHLVDVIAENGGRARSMVGRFSEDRDTRAVYCEDPWGTVIEVISESDERAWSNL